MKHVRKSLFKRFVFRGMSFFTVGRKKKIYTDFVDKFIHVLVANHYNSDGSGSLNASMRDKSSYLEILGSRPENHCLKQKCDIMLLDSIFKI
jgi:hypothetical protein